MSDPLERDTNERQDISDLLQFLLPEQRVLGDCSGFGLHYNRRLFDGWVAQPSPCCAAAAVAGAWNALCGLHRAHPEALTHTHVLEIYVRLVSEKIEKKVESFERRLGARLSDDFWTEFESLAASAFGKELGKKGSEITRGVADKVLRMMVAGLPAAVDEDKRDAMACLRELFDMEGPKAGSIMIEGKDDEEEENELAGDEVEDSRSSRFPASSQWQWRDDFQEILRHKAGRAKLLAERPSTAFIGNWGVLSAAAALSEDPLDAERERPLVRARLFMGKRASKATKIDVALSANTSTSSDAQEHAAVLAKEWDALRAAFSPREQVLLLHWRKHYALVFALREWTTSGGECVRQVLTARAGQRPAVWAHFEEVRESLLSWSGYKVMALRDERGRERNNGGEAGRK